MMDVIILFSRCAACSYSSEGWEASNYPHDFIRQIWRTDEAPTFISSRSLLCFLDLDTFRTHCPNSGIALVDFGEGPHTGYGQKDCPAAFGYQKQWRVSFEWETDSPLTWPSRIYYFLPWSCTWIRHIGKTEVSSFDLQPCSWSCSESQSITGYLSLLSTPIFWVVGIVWRHLCQVNHRCDQR